MAKKRAYLVEFSLMTRVIVDDTGNNEDMENDAVDKAIIHLVNHAEDYIYRDNLIDVYEDKEVPYGEGYNEE